MKTSKIITTIAALNLVLFMSVSSIANPSVTNTGDIVKKSVKNQIEVVKSTIIEITSTAASPSDFRHLRFDANKFNTESGIVELPVNSLDYLRFDASSYSERITSDITELPEMNEFDHLRFDANDFGNTSEISELPVNEFDYLRFDVSSFSIGDSGEIEELPARK